MRQELASVVEHLRRRPDIAALPSRLRRREIQMALMDIEGADPDNSVAIDLIEKQLDLVLPRAKRALALTDDELSVVLGKSRPTIQAYIAGRLREQITPDAARVLVRMCRARMAELAEITAVLERISRAG